MSLSPVQMNALKMIGAYVGTGVVAAIGTAVIESKVEQPGQNGIVDKLGLGAGLGAAGLTFMGPLVGFDHSTSIGKTAVLGGLLGAYVGSALIHKD
jgi:hypothetical protein